MSTNPIDGIGKSSIAPIAPSGGADDPTPNTSATPEKPKLKPPLERPFSLSLPPEKSTAEKVIENINESSKETERLTKKTADEQKLQKILEEKQAQDQLLNGSGTNGV